MCPRHNTRSRRSGYRHVREEPHVITRAEAARALLERRQARKHLRHFVPLAFETLVPSAQYKPNWHIDLICDYLEAVTRLEIPRLIINVQPRSLKSLIVSVAWPMWMMGNTPSLRFIGASYAQRLSIRFNVERRLLAQQTWYHRMFPGVMLSYDQKEKSQFVTAQRGMMMSTSVGSQATGDGGDYLVVDDPTDPQQALSDLQRTEANTWMDQTFTNRLNDKKKGGIVVIMQRLHENDLTGHLLEKGSWEHLKLPTRAPERTVIDFGSVHIIREQGDLLHPDREGERELQLAELDSGPYGWASQYQQEPVPVEGGLVKATWLRYYSGTAPVGNRKLQSYDTAFKTKEQNDFSAGIDAVEVVRYDEVEQREVKDLYLVDVMHEKLEFPELRLEMSRRHDAFLPSVVLVEDKASGQSAIQELERIPNIGPKLVKVSGNADKVAETNAAVPFIAAGHLYLPANAVWLEAIVKELTTFPYAKHDDFVVALVQLINYIKQPTPQYVY